MNKMEFETAAGKSITLEDFKKYVVMIWSYYPNFENSDDLAMLYKKFGLNIFKDMLPRAKAIHHYEKLIGAEMQEEAAHKQMKEALQRAREAIEQGGIFQLPNDAE